MVFHHLLTSLSLPSIGSFAVVQTSIMLLVLLMKVLFSVIVGPWFGVFPSHVEFKTYFTGKDTEVKSYKEENNVRKEE